MDNSITTWRRALAAALAALGLAAGTALAQPAAQPYVKSSLVQVDVYDRVDGTALPVYMKDGRHYIVGVPGHEYAVRIRNCTGGRVLVVTSVDGVNVISGDTASPGQSGYVLEPWASVEIAGWRKSMERTAAFYFTDLGDSYAARTGRPQNVGVIGVAVFQERPKRIVYREQDYRGRVAADEARRTARARWNAPDSAAASPPPAPAPAQAARGARDAAEAVAQRRTRRKRGAAAVQARHRPRPQRGLARDAHAVRARDVDAGRDGRDPVRPPRQPDRTGRAAAAHAAHRAPRSQSVPRRHAVRAGSESVSVRWFADAPSPQPSPASGRGSASAQWRWQAVRTDARDPGHGSRTWCRNRGALSAWRL